MVLSDFTASELRAAGRLVREQGAKSAAPAEAIANRLVVGIVAVLLVIGLVHLVAR